MGEDSCEDRPSKCVHTCPENSAESMIEQPQVNVYLNLRWKLRPELSRKLIEDALPEVLGVQIWIRYDRSATDVSRQHHSFPSWCRNIKDQI